MMYGGLNSIDYFPDSSVYARSAPALSALSLSDSDKLQSHIEGSFLGALGVTPPLTILHQLFNLSSFQLPHLSNGESHSRDCCEDEIHSVQLLSCV